MDEGICSCAVVGRAELDTYHGDGKHCDKKFVGTPVIELPCGIPISDKYAAPMNTVLTYYLETGAWAEVQKKSKPETKCGGDQEFSSEETSLTPLHMLGAYVLSGVLATVGIVPHGKYPNRQSKAVNYL